MTDSGQYRILGALGRGSFGTVYRAEKIGESGFSKTVALKVLNPDMSQKPEVAERLRDEARILGLLRHRAILQVDGLVRLGERWAVVMEYVEGVDLKDLIKAGPVPIGPALEVIGEIAGALHVAYNSAGPEGGPLRLLHRDIKPSNIFITSAGEVKILDFGVARADFGAREAATQQLRYGSMGYMSPERLDFIDTPAGDVYALGVLLWELVTAHSYGRSSSKEARHQSRLKENLDILWETTGGESQDFITFVESLLSYEPEDRPLARDVERQCGALRMNREGQLLRDWAEVIVPPLLEAQRNPEEEDPNSATMMIGSGSNRSVADMLDELDQDFEENKEEEGLGSDQMMSKWMPPTQEFYAPEGGGAAEFELGEIDGEKGGVRRRPWWLLSGTLAVVLLLGGVGAWWHLTGSQGTQQPTQTKALQNLPAQTPAAKPVAADDAAPPGNEALPADATQESSSSEQPDPDTPPATEDTTSSASAETETETKAETESDPKTESKPKPKPKPKTSSPASKSGVVSVTGDALKVMLVSSGGKRRKAGGSIPPGSYRIEASFVDQEPINAGQLQVSPGSANVIKCSSRFRRCTSKAQ